MTEVTDPGTRLRALIDDARKEVKVVGAETSDRACILLGAAMVEKRLKRLLDTRIGGEDAASRRGRNLTAGKALHLCRMLRLVPEGLTPDLRKIAEIRNRAVHSIEHAGFDHPDIAAMCRDLREPSARANAEHVRDRFLWTVAQCCLHLDVLTAHASPLEPLEVHEDAEPELSMQLALVLTWPSVAAMAARDDYDPNRDFNDEEE